MAIDYAKLAATAERLISENGRSLALRRPPNEPADPAKPWGARADDGEVVVSTTGAFFDLELEDRVPGPVEQQQQRVLIPPTPVLPEELDAGWQLDDGATRYEVLRARPLRPGPTLLYYEVIVGL